MAAARMKKPDKNQWEDHWTRRARAEGYPARSVYKLEEIQNRFKVIRPNDRVLDLGCAPGSWLLYAGKLVGGGGRVLGVDLTVVDIRLPDHVKAIQENIFNLSGSPVFDGNMRFNAVLSDMAPATTGRKDVDAARSHELCRMALEIADQFLVDGGHFVCKIFQGNDFMDFQNQVKIRFRECKVLKPESCRKHSKEIYIIAKDKIKEEKVHVGT